MTTAFNSYKTRMQKGKAVRQKKDPNDPAVLIEAVAKLTAKIRILDKSGWNAEDAALFSSALVDLKNGVEIWLASVPTENSAV